MLNVEAIDTRFGTANSEKQSNGNCFPLTGLPFNMNYFSIETTIGNWWFNPYEKSYRGFRLTHQPSMWSGSQGDFCSLKLLPFTEYSDGIDAIGYDNQKSTFSPHLLEIYCPNDELVNSLTISETGFIMKCDSINQNKGIRLSFPSGGEITNIGENTIAGYTLQMDPLDSKPLKMHFRINSNSKIKSSKIDEEDILFYFDSIDLLELRGGTSFISLENAEDNIEIRSFQEVLRVAKNNWNKKLEKIKVEGDKKDNEETFYHSLYRVFLFPQKAYELNQEGQPIHFDKYSQSTKRGYLYMNTGFWDTSRTLFPLLTLIDQKEYEKMLEGFLNSYKESGFLPKWLAPEDKGSMPGNYIDSVIADAVVKEIKPELWKELYEGMLHSDSVKSKGSKGKRFIEEYKEFGYVTDKQEESVSYTLDYAFDDFCISKVAKAMNDERAYGKYIERAKNYRFLFSKTERLMIPKDSDGNFRKNFSSITWGEGFTESSSYHNTYSVFHDIQGLIDLHPDEETFVQGLIKVASELPKYKVGSYKRLIHEMLEMEINDFGQVNIGNQPSFHFPYLFSFVNKMHYSQPLIKQILDRCFTNGFEAFPGDEDNGSMAAWYVFNSLGFYPFCPGSGEYLIGIPNFKKAVIRLENGEELLIQANQNKIQHQFVYQCNFNGKKSSSFVKHDELLKGGTLEFELGCVPNPNCFDYTKKPFSLSRV